MSEQKSQTHKANLPAWMIDKLRKEGEEKSFQHEHVLHLPLFPIQQEMPIADTNPTPEYNIVDYVIRNDVMRDI